MIALNYMSCTLYDNRILAHTDLDYMVTLRYTDLHYMSILRDTDIDYLFIL